MAEHKIINIDKEKCNGCGICVDSCHEGAIQMVNGKAELVSEIYCDGLGDCLGPCPTGAISMISRDAEEYDPAATAQRQKELGLPVTAEPAAQHRGCPGSMAQTLKPVAAHATGAAVLEKANQPLPCGCPGSMAKYLPPVEDCKAGDCQSAGDTPSQLVNWPLQLKLVPQDAPYFKNADILIAADCAAAAAPDFHRKYLQQRPVILTCPKLDEAGPKILKLANIIQSARPASLTVLRMQVPCCGGLVRIAEQAIELSGIDVPLTTIVIDNRGNVVS